MEEEFIEEKRVAKKAAQMAGDLLMQYFNQEKELIINTKGINDICTEADLAAEKVIIDTIKESFPLHEILSEEMGSSGSSEYKWIIDPLDGTHNFSFGIPWWGTAIALQHKDKIVVSVVNTPIFEEMYAAVKNSGTFINEKLAHVSKRKDRTMIIVGGLTAYKDNFVKSIFDNIANEFCNDFRHMGSIAMTGGLISSGRADGAVVLNYHPWDIGPAALLIEEAGGKVTDINGNQWNPYQKHYILSNGIIHSKIMDCINGQAMFG